MSAKAEELARIEKKTWIQSYSGLQVFPLDLKPESVKLEDVAHALSQKCRFTGHTIGLYSVAQHCCLGADLLPASFKLAFLLHEVSEAYLPDVAAPIKGHVHVATSTGALPWRDLESIHADIIMGALGLSSIRFLIDSEEVKTMDLAMLAAEAEGLMAEPPADWGLTIPAAYPADRMVCWEPFEAKSQWLSRFKRWTDASSY